MDARTALLVAVVAVAGLLTASLLVGWVAGPTWAMAGPGTHHGPGPGTMGGHGTMGGTGVMGSPVGLWGGGWVTLLAVAALVAALVALAVGRDGRPRDVPPR